MEGMFYDRFLDPYKEKDEDDEYEEIQITKHMSFREKKNEKKQKSSFRTKD